MRGDTFYTKAIFCYKGAITITIVKNPILITTFCVGSDWFSYKKNDWKRKYVMCMKLWT